MSVIPAAVGGRATPNTLPAPVVGGSATFPLTGWLIYRVYAPYAPARPQNVGGGVDVPTLTVHLGGTSTTLPPCRQPQLNPSLEASARALLAKVIARAPMLAPELQFQYDAGGSLFPDVDNKYVFALTAWQPERVIVVTAEAPAFPDTPADAIIANPPWQLRYWSMCTNSLIGLRVVACADDANTQPQLDSAARAKEIRLSDIVTCRQAVAYAAGRDLAALVCTQ